MKHLYYLVGIAFIIYEMMWIINPKERAEKSEEMRKESDKHKGKSWSEYSEHYKSLIQTRGLAGLIMTIWLITGIFTFNWVAFVVKLSFNVIIISPISRLTRYSTFYVGLHWFNSLLGLAFGIFVIINSYHLKIDLYEWLIKLIQ